MIHIMHYTSKVVAKSYLTVETSIHKNQSKMNISSNLLVSKTRSYSVARARWPVKHAFNSN